MRPVIICLLLLLSSLCLHANKKPAWKKTPNGMLYRVLTNDPAKPKPQAGDHIWMQLRKYAPDGKEVFNTRIFEATDGVETDLKPFGSSADVTAVFAYMGKGDSALVKVSEYVLEGKGSKKRFFHFHLTLRDFLSQTAFQVQQQAKAREQYRKDSLAMEQYLQQHQHSDAGRDSLGNRYYTETQGSGPFITEGDSVSMHYIGKLLNGEEFDNSYYRQQTLSFVVGQKQVIEGLDKGLRHFRKGDKAVILIPSGWAYGDKAVGKIPANSVLIFEMELME